MCYNQNMQTKKGFTILELLVVVGFSALLFLLFFTQKMNVDAMERDEKRKIAINAMFYALEEGFLPANGYYPETISEENLKVIDPQLFTDPFGVNLGKGGSSYQYEAADCEDGKCKEYTLKAVLEKEDIYIRKNRNNQKK